MTVTTSRALVETRESWHRLAEHVLAAGQFADSGRSGCAAVAFCSEGRARVLTDRSRT